MREPARQRHFGLNQKMHRLLTSLVLALPLSLSGPLVPTASAQDTLRAAAVVNDEVISMLDLAMRTRLAILSGGLEDAPEVRQRLRPQVLRTLVDERLQMQEAVRLDISVTESQIDDAVQRIAQQNRLDRQAFMGVLQQNGILPTVLRDQIRAGLTWQLVINARLRPSIDVTDEEVDAVVERIRTESGGLEFRVSEIFLPVDNVLQEDEVAAMAQRLVDQLRGGANFAALARQFSQSATASVGGDLGWVRDGQLAEELSTVLKALRPGQISRPIQTFGGIYLLLLGDQRQRSLGDPLFNLKQVIFPLPPEASQEQRRGIVAQADAARTQINSCPAADQVSQQFGAAGTRDLDGRRLSELPVEMGNLVSTLPIGQPSEPLRMGDAAVLLIVCGRDEGDIDREAILNSLINERLSLQARRYLRDLRRAANVDLRV